MPPRLTIDKINNEIMQEGYTCKSYDIKSKKFDYICDKGHTGSVRLDHWRRGVRCAICFGNKKLSIECVRNAFSKEGYKLLDDIYINSKTLLTSICPEGHEYKVSWNTWNSGCRCSSCSHILRFGENNPNYKGNILQNKLPLYGTYAIKLEKYQSVYLIKYNNLDLLGVECKYCRKIFIPKIYEINNRIASILNKVGSEHNIYCSKKCKQSCSTYRQARYTKDNKPYKENIRVDQKFWSDLVKTRDNYTCQKCGVKEKIMYAHHIDPVINNPIESADIDNGITLCRNCHKKIHSSKGCSLLDLKCN